MSQKRRPRRTRAAVEEAITEAVFAELANGGYAALTFVGVAQRAGVSKHVLYRRHSTRAALVIAALQEKAETVYAQPPATGSLRGDLLAWVRAAEAQPLAAATFRGLVGEASEAELAHVATLMAARARDVQRCVIDPARQRGELTRDPPATVARLFFTLLRDKALFGSSGDEDATWMVDEVLLPLFAGRRKVGANSG